MNIWCSVETTSNELNNIYKPRLSCTSLFRMSIQSGFLGRSLYPANAPITFSRAAREANRTTVAYRRVYATQKKLWGASTGGWDANEMTWKNLCTPGWRNKCTNDFIESMNEYDWISETMSQWINGSVNQLTKEWVNQWINESVDQWISESMNESSESMSHWSKEWVEWVDDQWTFEWTNERMDG